MSTRNKKHQHKKQLSQLKESLNDFFIGNNTNASAIRDETFKLQTNSRFIICTRTIVREKSACQNQIIESKFDDTVRKPVDKVVKVVEKRMHHATLTALDKVVIPRVDITVPSIFESSRRGPSSMVKNPDQSDCTE